MTARTVATLLRLARHAELARMALRHVPEALPVVQKLEALERSITHALVRGGPREVAEERFAMRVADFGHSVTPLEQEAEMDGEQ